MSRRVAIACTVAALASAGLGALSPAAAPAAGVRTAQAGTSCAAAPRTGSQTIVLRVDGENRTVVLHVPAAPAGTHLPLLLAYHGFGGSGVMMERETGLSTLANARGFIVAYPEARQGHWSVRSSARSEQDLDLTRATIDYVEARYCVDAARVFAAGVSNGGSMAAHVACELSTRFAAVAVVAGDYRAADPCAPERPVSILVIHAVDDRVVPYAGFQSDGGAGGVFGFLDLWVALDRCSPAIRRAHVALHMLELAWGCPATGTRVAHVRLTRGGHGWPGADPPPGVIPSPASASGLLWQFFSTMPARAGEAGPPPQRRPAPPAAPAPRTQ